MSAKRSRGGLSKVKRNGLPENIRFRLIATLLSRDL